MAVGTATLSFTASSTVSLTGNSVAAVALPLAVAASSTLRTALNSTLEGMRILLISSPLLRLSTITLLAIVMVLGAFQGIVLPFFYVEQGAEDMLGLW